MAQRDTAQQDGAKQALSFDVAISGASFAGLALACALTDALGPEFKIAIIDRVATAEPRPDARAFALSAASRHLLEAIGVWEQVAVEAQPVDGIDITDSALEAGVRPVLLAYDNTTEAGEAATHILPVEPPVAGFTQRSCGAERDNTAGARGGERVCRRGGGGRSLRLPTDAR